MNDDQIYTYFTKNDVLDALAPVLAEHMGLVDLEDVTPLESDQIDKMLNRVLGDKQLHDRIVERFNDAVAAAAYYHMQSMQEA